MKIQIYLRPIANGLDFWRKAAYRLEIDKQIISQDMTPLEVLEAIEDEMMRRSKSVFD